jgi:septal ring-binding cell division protein DamX
VTTTPAEERRAAAAAADETCPRCGAARSPDQEYCVECGLRLPAVGGAVSGLRRRWVRRLGWYPGDWIWASLLTLVVAAVGAAAAILLTRHENAKGGETFVATSSPLSTVAEPTTAPATTATTTVNTATLPTAPEPTTAPTRPKGPPQPPNGRTLWPAGRNGWTVVLISYPTRSGRASAYATATRAARAGLTEVGVLDSARYSSLHPGYYVVFSGVYGSKARADAAVRTARASGFAGAYTRPISR